jgi:hypothetical protein
MIYINNLYFSQVLSLRSLQGSSKGIFLGAKGGSNGESHNHNDVGNFVVYLNGEPALIDVGVGTYSKQTFNKDRYKLWYMQSQWHNLPTINGIMQHEGANYKAHNVSFKSTTNGGNFEMDIAGAYPKEAQVKSWKRDFHFDGKLNSITLKETFELNQVINKTDMHFMTILHTIQETGVGKLKLSSNKAQLMIEYDEKMLQFSHEQKECKDHKLENDWGKFVTRLTFRLRNESAKSGSIQFTFKIASNLYSSTK